MNYDNQTIVVILKITTIFFQQQPWIIESATHAQYEL